MRVRPDRLRSDRGSSLIELMVVVLIMLIIVAAALSVLDSGTKAERTQQARSDALIEVRQAMIRLTKDVRQATALTESSTPSRLEIDTLVAGEQTHLVFEVVDGELLRWRDDGGAVPLAARVSSEAPFCYNPPTCDADTAGDGVSIIRVTLSVEPDAFSRGPIELATDVHLRNL